MDLTKLTSDDLKHITALLQEKESLLKEIQRIDDALAGYQTGSAPKRITSRRGPKPRGTAKVASSNGKAKTRERTSDLKEKIIAELQSAGSDGLSVKELCSRLGKKPANIHAWFFNTGKKISNIQKAGTARYVWMSDETVES